MTAPWAVVEADPERLAAELERRFPGVAVWRGEYTGSWWALARDRLVEAASAAELARRLDVLAAPRHVPRYARADLPRTRPAKPPVRRPRRLRRGWFRGLFDGLAAT